MALTTAERAMAMAKALTPKRKKTSVERAMEMARKKKTTSKRGPGRPRKVGRPRKIISKRKTTSKRGPGRPRKVGRPRKTTTVSKRKTTSKRRGPGRPRKVGRPVSKTTKNKRIKNYLGGWASVAKNLDRKALKRSCFLEPDKLKFPICTQDNVISCAGLKSAVMRSRLIRRHDPTRFKAVEAKAQKLIKKFCD